MNQRQKDILKYVNDNMKVTLQELMTRYSMSEQTIRNDIRTLHEQGNVRRVHGGVESLQQTHENPYSNRIRKNYELKNIVGAQAAKLLQPNDTIFLDAGTSILAMIEYIPHDFSMTVVTNALHIAQRLASFPNIQIHLVGGILNKQLFEACGPKTINELSKMRFHKSFISVSEYSASYGISEDHPMSAEIKKLIIGQSNETIVLADSTKQNEFTLSSFMSWENIDIFILDDGITQETKDRLVHSQVKIITAKS